MKLLQHKMNVHAQKLATGGKDRDSVAPAADKANHTTLEMNEFGGPVGTFFIIIWSHFILLYFWFCLEAADGKMIIPLTPSSLMECLSKFSDLLFSKGIPSMYTWGIYLSFYVIQLVFAAVLPGFSTHGLPISPDGHRLAYLCNGYACYYLIMLGLLIADFMDVFHIEYLVENYGEVLIASMIIGDLTSVYWYVYGVLLNKEARTGNIIYDFFMGTILYPRIGIVDIKMIAEVRWSWMTLMLLTLSSAVAQFKRTGYISPQMFHMLTAHWLYSNATVKGEHYIPCTWDMFHENFGWMLNFWNICGVPFQYCFQSMYILRNQDSLATYPTYLLVLNYILLLTAYFIFDTANCQKASFKSTCRRHLFPDMPWSILKPPYRYLQTPYGKLLLDGWYAFARKIQYTGDILMALSWGLACGFGSPIPYFYLVFFIVMILHRQSRDEAKCKLKYGKYWDIYTQCVPNVFIPSKSFFVWLFTGKEPEFPLLDSIVKEDELKKD
jgi:delta24(24(1))-sterol reductase